MDKNVLRWQFRLGWFSLVINVLLIVLLIQAWWPSYDHAATLAQELAAEFGELAPQLNLGLDVYSTKDPFAILVDKNFPHTDRYIFLVRGRPFLVIAEGDVEGDDVDEDDANAMKGVVIAFGNDFSIGCEYTDTHGSQTRQITLFNNDQYFTDLNADGQWDNRIVMPKQFSQTPPPLQIWYHDRWEELPQAISQPLHVDLMPSRYKAQLHDGTRVTFDMQRGQWLSEMDESAVNRDQEM